MTVLPAANLGAVIAQWIEEELLPKAAGWQKVATVMAGTGIAANAERTLQQYLPTLQMLGFATSDGGINIDAVQAAAKSAFEKTGKVPLLGGVIVGAEDVDSIIAIARKFAVNV